MANRRERMPQRQMKKVALVICEGETEAEYVNLVRRWYKSPIKIISRVEGAKITQSLIDKRIADIKISSSDKVDTFLMYDMDVPYVTEKLMQFKEELLLSNPCFEIWFLLHSKDQRSALSSDNTLKELKGSNPVWNNYKKGMLTETQKIFLGKNLGDAIDRAKHLGDFKNPSSRVFRLLEFLEKE